MVGGASVGVMLGLAGPLLGWVPSPVAIGLVAAMATMVGLDAYGLSQFRWPQVSRQVARTSAADGLTGLWKFGFEMGTGARTYMPVPTPHLVVLTVLLVGGGYGVAVFAGLGFAGGRAVMPITRMLHAEPMVWDRLLSYSSRRLTRLAAWGSGIVAVVLATGT